MAAGGEGSEFARIAAFLRPLAATPAARDLADDGALLAPPARGWAVTTDTVVEGVHYRRSDPPGSIARKLLGVNLSDCAALAAWPVAYSLNLALPERCDGAWWAAFTAGLAACQRRMGMALIGGDCSATPGPPVLSATVFGQPPASGLLSRAAARPGDWVWVSGTLGDGALGLAVASGALGRRERAALTPVQERFLADRYRHPRARVALGWRLRPGLSAGLDVSDGLVGDLRHLAAASGVGICLDAAAVPVSAATRALLAAAPGLQHAVLTGGDDYELAVTAPPSSAGAIRAQAATLGVPMTPVGEVVSGTGVACYDGDGAPLELGRTGWQHGG